jgi:hypothetical protein
MDFLDIVSLGAAYRYVVKIVQKFKQKRQEFGSANSSQPKQGKGDLNLQKKGQRKDGHSQDNQSKTQHKKGNEKSKKNTGKWCEYHKIPWHNIEECRSKQSLVAELKASESEEDSNSESNIEGGKYIIDSETSATFTTTKFHPRKPYELEEEEHLFHSQIWVKGAPLHFIVNNSSQKNLISTEVIKRLELPMKSYPHPYTIGWLR